LDYKSGTSGFTFAATPMPGAAAWFERIGPRLEADLKAWCSNNAMGNLEYSKENSGISWTPFPLITPTIQSLPLPNGEYVFGRLAPTLPPPGKPAEPALLSQIAAKPNLVYYDWEITQTRVNDWIFLGQSARVVLRREQLPLKGEGMNFLVAVKSKLGNSATELEQSGPTTLKLVRTSHLGVTGFELHLLIDWLESPRFPVGLYSLLEKSPHPLFLRGPSRPVRTNTVPFSLQGSNSPAAPK
jgi:hypothetical protein